MVKLLSVIEIIRNGQVLSDWIERHHPDSLIVASDTLAHDPVQSLQLRLLTPKGMRVAVKQLRGAVILIQTMELDVQTVAVITERVEDALAILEQNIEVEQIYLAGIRREDERVLRRLLQLYPDCLVEHKGKEPVLLAEVLKRNDKPFGEGLHNEYEEEQK